MLQGVIYNHKRERNKTTKTIQENGKEKKMKNIYDITQTQTIQNESGNFEFKITEYTFTNRKSAERFARMLKSQRECKRLTSNQKQTGYRITILKNKRTTVLEYSSC